MGHLLVCGHSYLSPVGHVAGGKADPALDGSHGSSVNFIMGWVQGWAFNLAWAHQIPRTQSELLRTVVYFPQGLKVVRM